MSVRFAFRRVFDLFRGIDALIWSVILSRAFGPGPLTGSLAILMTDVGTFGKTFSKHLRMLTTNKLRASPQQERKLFNFIVLGYSTSFAHNIGTSFISV